MANGRIVPGLRHMTGVLGGAMYAVAALSVAGAATTAHADDPTQTQQRYATEEEYSQEDVWRMSQENGGQLVIHYGAGLKEEAESAVRVLKLNGFEKSIALPGFNKNGVDIWANGRKMPGGFFTEREINDGTALADAAWWYNKNISRINIPDYSTSRSLE